MRSSNKNYVNINEPGNERRESTPWYWRLIALAASWMILGGCVRNASQDGSENCMLIPRSYLILPGLYANDPQLRYSEAVLSVFVVALLTAGYSFTALLCFACRNDRFQADGVFL
jgi:hypothetical protein